MTPAPKPRRISREEAIIFRLIAEDRPYRAWLIAVRMAEREQKAADAKKKEAKR